MSTQSQGRNLAASAFRQDRLCSSREACDGDAGVTRAGSRSFPRALSIHAALRRRTVSSRSAADSLLYVQLSLVLERGAGAYSRRLGTMPVGELASFGGRKHRCGAVDSDIVLRARRYPARGRAPRDTSGRSRRGGDAGPAGRLQYRAVPGRGLIGGDLAAMLKPLAPIWRSICRSSRVSPGARRNTVGVGVPGRESRAFRSETDASLPLLVRGSLCPDHPDLGGVVLYPRAAGSRAEPFGFGLCAVRLTVAAKFRGAAGLERRRGADIHRAGRALSRSAGLVRLVRPRGAARAAYPRHRCGCSRSWPKWAATGREHG